MSAPRANDENHGVCLVSKYSASETSSDIFAIVQPTGRPSILRQSQVDNLPSKAAPKGVKVCFQTPRRDPVTKRIVSPTNVLKMADPLHSEDGIQVIEMNHLEENSSLRLSGTVPEDGLGSPGVPLELCPEDIPISSKGEYHLDFGNLDTVNPFQGSNLLANSPAKNVPAQKLQLSGKPGAFEEPPVGAALSQPLLELSANTGDQISETANKAESCLDETLPFMSMDGSVVDLSTEVCSTESTVIIDMKHQAEAAQIETSLADEPEPQASCSQQQDIQVKNVPETLVDAQNSPTFPRSTYNFDFDSLDSVNPFQTGGSKLQNSPVLSRKLPDSPTLLALSDHPEMQPMIPEPIPPTKDQNVSPPVQESPALPAEQPVLEKPQLKTKTAEPSSVAPYLSTSPPTRDVPLKLEFNFGDEVTRKPPPKMLGERPPRVKPASKKAVRVEGGVQPKAAEAPAASDDPCVDIPAPKVSYNFDGLDDPNFNPFMSGSKISNSPKSSEKCTVSPKSEAFLETLETSLPEKLEAEDKPAAASVPGDAEEETPSKETSDTAVVTQAQETPVSSQVEEGPSACEVICPESPAPQGPILTPPAKAEPEILPDTGLAGAEEEFVPGATFLADNFEGQIDYLEQFGSTTFKESALRKQSLYMKFDPLLRDSPKKMPPNSELNGLPLPAAFVSRLEERKPKAESELRGDKFGGLNFLEDLPAPAVGALVQDVPVALDCLVPPFSQLTGAEDAIFEVLRYSQKDMDAALDKVRSEVESAACREAKEREDEWNAKYMKLSQDNHEMGKIMSDFEATISQIIADNTKEKQDLQEELKKVQHEKEQVALDLSAMERSFSELFKRLEKHKEVIEGYKKNEETLKKCAQDYLARIKKEEQRYQALKAHAEEKIGQANMEIAQLRTKQKAEMSALQARLRREELKVQSLEKSLEQKVKETEELTKLCDDLIVNVQKR
ncbi:transforming acidic coiled-coil-containing protein 3 isoform X2 [Brienomyrus brachyistius]|nr:transforming acidic coiled-coil-containing protein 3 isoform X2 [Brienomyrus brachyistius]XP_048851920.1 transforming acidic coiled-coil-containing protein 3 isoform X2 [Brienomyrus brachyistius]